MRIPIIAVAVVALAVGLFFSHTFAYKSGINAAVASVQAEALDQVAAVEADKKVIQSKDSLRYAELDKTHKSLQNEYDKLLKESRARIKPGDAEKYTVCTYDDATLQLLKDSASGGTYRAEPAGARSGSNDPVYRPAVARYWISSRDNRTYYRERPAILPEPLLTPVAYRGGTGPAEPKRRI